MTDRKITPDLEILNIKLVLRNPSMQDMEFYNDICGKGTHEHLSLIEIQNINFNHIYGSNGYQSV